MVGFWNNWRSCRRFKRGRSTSKGGAATPEKESGGGFLSGIGDFIGGIINMPFKLIGGMANGLTGILKSIPFFNKNSGISQMLSKVLKPAGNLFGLSTVFQGIFDPSNALWSTLNKGFGLFTKLGSYFHSGGEIPKNGQLSIIQTGEYYVPPNKMGNWNEILGNMQKFHSGGTVPVYHGGGDLLPDERYTFLEPGGFVFSRNHVKQLNKMIGSNKYHSGGFIPKYHDGKLPEGITDGLKKAN